MKPKNISVISVFLMYALQCFFIQVFAMYFFPEQPFQILLKNKSIYGMSASLHFTKVSFKN